MKVYDFECAQGHIHERFMHSDAMPVSCPECGQSAEKKVSAPRFTLEGWSGAFPGAAMKWDRRHEKAHRDSVLSGETTF